MRNVIDLTKLDHANTAAVRRVAAELRRAYRGVGFFSIRNHGLPNAHLTAIADRRTANSRRFYMHRRPVSDALEQRHLTAPYGTN